MCEEPHPSFVCSLVTQEKDEEKLKSSLKYKGICLKCLCKHTEDCRDPKAAYVCTTHQVNKKVCKSEKKAAKLQSNSCINSTVLGNVGFDTEVVIIRYGKKMMQTILTYDSFASHTTLNYIVRDKLSLDTKYIGDLQINTYNGIKSLVFAHKLTSLYLKIPAY